MRRIALAAAWLLGLATVGPVAAQGVLERLEQQIRKQLPPDSTASQNAGPSEIAAPAAPAAPASGTAAGSAAQAGPVAGQTPSEERGYLGIVTDDRLDRGRGVRILQVRPGDPGEKAGLRTQDLITGLGGIRVRQMSDLAAILEHVPPGSSLPFDVVRGQQRLKIDVVFGKRPPSNEEPAARPQGSSEGPQTGPALVAPEFPDRVPPQASPSPPAPEMPPPPAAAPAIAESPQADRARIEALERRVKQLEERLQQLERAMPRRLKRE